SPRRYPGYLLSSKLSSKQCVGSADPLAGRALTRLTGQVWVGGSGRMAFRLLANSSVARDIGGGIRSRGLVPQANAAGQAIGVRDDRDIRRQRKGDVLGIPPAEVEVVEPDDLAQDIDHL